jgi:predicted  nucleic acid-binding Zn-ribbon protein
MRVQELDTTISQLDHRKLTLPDRLALGQVETQLVALDARGSQVRARRDAVVARLADLQGQVDTLQTRRATVTERMYSLRGSATRDLQAMDEEVRHLALRQSELEDEELEVMEEQEPLDAEVSEIDHERTTLEETAGRLRSAVAAEESGIEAELSAVRADRRQAFDHVPPDLAHQYETLRARLGGTGAARLVANRCEGCHLQLPAVEIDRIKRLPRDAVATCEQCGRILVRTAATS